MLIRERTWSSPLRHGWTCCTLFTSFFNSNTEFRYVLPFHKTMTILVLDPDTNIPNIRTRGFQKYMNLTWSRHCTDIWRWLISQSQRWWKPKPQTLKHPIKKKLWWMQGMQPLICTVYLYNPRSQNSRALVFQIQPTQHLQLWWRRNWNKGS